MIRPITVMSYKMAAVVTPVTSRSRLTIAPAPMNPSCNFGLVRGVTMQLLGRPGRNFRAYKNCLHS